MSFVPDCICERMDDRRIHTDTDAITHTHTHKTRCICILVHTHICVCVCYVKITAMVKMEIIEIKRVVVAQLKIIKYN